MPKGKKRDKGKYHRERVKEPSEFEEKGMGDSKFKLKTVKKGLKLIIGRTKKKKGEKKRKATSVQSVLCLKEDYTAKECKNIADKIRKKAK